MRFFEHLIATLSKQLTETTGYDTDQMYSGLSHAFFNAHLFHFPVFESTRR